MVLLHISGISVVQKRKFGDAEDILPWMFRYNVVNTATWVEVISIGTAESDEKSIWLSK